MCWYQMAYPGELLESQLHLSCSEKPIYELLMKPDQYPTKYWDSHT